VTSGHDEVDWYREDIMMPTMKEFTENPGDRRHAFLAAMVVSHFADYIFEERPPLRGSFPHSRKGLSDYREWLALKCPEWGLVRDIGDVSKHCRLTRRTAEVKETSSVRPQTQFLVDEKGNRLITEDGDSITAGDHVYVITTAGQEYEVFTLLTKAIEFLERVLVDPALLPP
jgi:hypothetical protein